MVPQDKKKLSLRASQLDLFDETARLLGHVDYETIEIRVIDESHVDKNPSLCTIRGGGSPTGRLIPSPPPRQWGVPPMRTPVGKAKKDRTQIKLRRKQRNKK